MVGVEWSNGVEDAWSRVAQFVPKLVAFLLVLLIGFVVAKILARAAETVLERVGFDRAVERGGVGRAMAHTKYDASDLVSRIVFYALMLIVLQMAFGVFGPNPVSDLIEGVIAYLPKVIVAILIVVVAAAIAAAVKEIVEAALGGLSYGKAVAIGASVVILGVGVFAALDQLQIAPRIVSGLFYALLAIVAGSAIIAIGGGGIAPMRRRWESALERYDAEKQRLRDEGQGAGARVQARLAQRKAEAQAAMVAPSRQDDQLGSRRAGR